MRIGSWLALTLAFLAGAGAKMALVSMLGRDVDIGALLLGSPVCVSAAAVAVVLIGGACAWRMFSRTGHSPPFGRLAR